MVTSGAKSRDKDLRKQIPEDLLRRDLLSKIAIFNQSSI